MPQWTVFCEVVTLVIRTAHKILLMQIPFWLALSKPSYKWASYLRGEAFCGNTGGQTTPSTAPCESDGHYCLHTFCCLGGASRCLKCSHQQASEITKAHSTLWGIFLLTQAQWQIHIALAESTAGVYATPLLSHGGRNEQPKARAMSGSRPSAHTPKAPMTSPLLWQPSLEPWISLESCFMCWC